MRGCGNARPSWCGTCTEADRSSGSEIETNGVALEPERLRPLERVGVATLQSDVMALDRQRCSNGSVLLVRRQAPCDQWSSPESFPCSRAWNRSANLPRSCRRPANVASPAHGAKPAKPPAKRPTLSKWSRNGCHRPASFRTVCKEHHVPSLLFRYTSASAPSCRVSRESYPALAQIMDPSQSVAWYFSTARWSRSNTLFRNASGATTSTSGPYLRMSMTSSRGSE